MTVRTSRLRVLQESVPAIRAALVEAGPRGLGWSRLRAIAGLPRFGNPHDSANASLRAVLRDLGAELVHTAGQRGALEEARYRLGGPR